ncbi:MAG: VWA domain-containing protein, partial [Myxococcota bacterium]
MAWSFEQPWLLLTLLAIPVLLVWTARSAGLNDRVTQIATGLRCGVILLLALALAGLSLLDEHDELSVMYVVDVSRSIAQTETSAQEAEPGGSSGTRRARAFVEASLKARKDNDRAGVVVFGSQPEVETLVRASSELPSWSSQPPVGGTHIEAALRLALAAFPPDTHRRIVLLSDGVETHGQATAQSIVARELGVPIDVVALPTAAQGPDTRVEGLMVPPSIEAFQPFDLKVQIRSPGPARGRLLLYRDAQLLGELPVEMKGGLDVITIPQKLAEGGLHRYRVTLDVEGDAEPRNNEARATVHTEGKAQVLLLEGYEGSSSHLKAALERAHFAVTEGDIGDVPETLEQMVVYDVIILSDIPATELGRLQMSAMAQVVTDLGKGLIMIGGDRSFGVGGYYKTPIASILPVSMTREAKKEMPSQGIVLAIDRSGSMGGFHGANGPSKIALAKEAAVFVVELLTSRDELGVMGFDGAASWVLPYGKLDDKSEAMRRIATLRAGGGTNIYNALQAAFRGIKRGDSATKHIILMSDGIAENSDLPSLARTIHENSITLTTVAIGSDSDRYTMETLARIGGGRYYETESADAIPQIFTRETLMASRNFLIEQEFVPEVV